MSQNQEMLSSAPYHKLLLRLCVPSIAIMLVMVVYNMADTFFIGQTGNAGQIAAVSLCGPMFSLLSGLGTLFGNGGCTVISLALGNKDESKIKSVSSFCCLGSITAGAVFLVITLCFMEPICYALGADEGTIQDACGYLRIIALGAPFIMFSTVFASIIRSDGAAVSSMICNGLGTISNIILDALFILGFSWGVRGAALATVLGNAISCVYLIIYIYKKQPLFAFRFDWSQWKMDMCFQILSLGLPMAFSTLLMSTTHILSNRLMMSYSSTALAAQGVAGKVGMLISMLIMGLCMGLQPAVSYNFAAKQLQRMYGILRNTINLTVAIGMVLSILCFFLRDALVAAFIDDAEVIAYGRVMVIASLLTGPFYGIYQMCQTFLQSTGKASYAIVLSLLDKGIFFIPCLYLMEHFFHLYGFVFASPVTLFLSLGISIILALRWNGKIGGTKLKIRT